MSNISCPLEWQTETKELNSCQVTTNYSCGIEIFDTSSYVIPVLVLLLCCCCYASFAKHLRMKISDIEIKSFDDSNLVMMTWSYWNIVQFYYLWFSYFLSNLECCPSFKWWLNIYLVVEYKIGNFGGVSCVRKRRTSL